MYSEYEKARRWRQKLGLTQTELGKLTGYSIAAISWFERGLTPPRGNGHLAGPNADDRSIKPSSWRRYKQICAAVDQQLKSKREFRW